MLECTERSSFASPKMTDSYSSNPESPAKIELLRSMDCGLKEERFRIDRKKLEDMLQVPKNSDSDEVENADDFFQRVTADTSTLISWPSKLKIGAKSKKDPHVKIVGKPEDVQLAKEMILEILDTKKNRVTLKMDVSHTDHSYIIGKGGFKIQQVMEETGCHIHFPDSNRNNAVEKSNQVSIAGQASGVQLARAKIRELLPLMFIFELPNGRKVKPGDECKPDIQHIQQTYSFHLTFHSIGPIDRSRTVLVVRASQRLLSRLRQGLSFLMEYLTGSQTIPVMGVMKTEIAAQHHQFVMGAGSVNVHMIMNKTAATIIFPEQSRFEPESPGQTGNLIPVITKSTVLIQGSFDSVCLAWKELLKCLPLVLMFDLKEGDELDPFMVNEYMEMFNISIMVRPKMKENTKSVLIRGAEKDCDILFQVRKGILGLEDDDSPVSISDKSDFDVPPVNEGFRRFGSPRIENRTPAQGMSTAESLNLLSSIIQRNPHILGVLNNLSTTCSSANSPDVAMPTLPNPGYRPVHQPIQQIPMNHYSSKSVENWINQSNSAYGMSTSGFSGYSQNKYQHAGDDDDSGVSEFSRSRYQTGYETRSDFSSQPESSASSASSNDTPDFKTNSFLEPCRPKELHFMQSTSDVHNLLADYGNKKLTASRAMQQPIGEGARTPNMLWSGYGFSKSMPDYAARTKRGPQNSGSISEFLDTDNSAAEGTPKTWNLEIPEKDSPSEQVSSPFAFSNFWENVPQKHSFNYSLIENLEQLLSLLDLEKYNDVMEYHEIDLATFLTLTDFDLQQLEVTYTARRRMLSAISDIKDHRLSVKSFRAAPGAERKMLPQYPASPFRSGSMDATM